MRDLARLGRDQGQANEARTRLVTLYGEFTEGFEMPDLIAARQII
jgi:hypothetical protein